MRSLVSNKYFKARDLELAVSASDSDVEAESWFSCSDEELSSDRSLSQPEKWPEMLESSLEVSVVEVTFRAGLHSESERQCPSGLWFTMLIPRLPDERESFKALATRCALMSELVSNDPTRWPLGIEESWVCTLFRLDVASSVEHASTTKLSGNFRLPGPGILFGATWSAQVTTFFLFGDLDGFSVSGLLPVLFPLLT